MDNRNNDNFDALWDRLKQSVRERREPQTVHTTGDGAFSPKAGRVFTDDPYEDEHGLMSSTMFVSASRSSIVFDVTKDDLINIAEHCLLRAAQFDSGEI